jgi:hypothetical protein
MYTLTIQDSETFTVSNNKELNLKGAHSGQVNLSHAAFVLLNVWS